MGINLEDPQLRTGQELVEVSASQLLERIVQTDKVISQERPLVWVELSVESFGRQVVNVIFEEDEGHFPGAQSKRSGK